MDRKFKAFLVFVAEKDFAAFDVSAGTVVEWDPAGNAKPLMVVSTEDHMRKLSPEEISDALKSAKKTIECVKAAEQAQTLAPIVH